MPEIMFKAEQQAGVRKIIRIMQGDTRSHIIRFVVPRYESGVDLAPLAWYIKFIDAADVSDISLPYSVYEVTDRELRVRWEIESVHTNKVGSTLFQLRGVGRNAAGEQVIWESGIGEIEVTEGIGFNVTEEQQTALDKLILDGVQAHKLVYELDETVRGEIMRTDDVLNKINSITHPMNLFDAESAQTDKWLYPPDQGGLVTAVGYTVTDYIMVHPGHVLVASDDISRSGGKNVRWIRSGSPVYDADKNYIGTNDLFGANDSSWYYHNNTDSAQYVRLNLNSGFVSLMIEETDYDGGSFAPSGTFAPYGVALIRPESLPLDGLHGDLDAFADDVVVRNLYDPAAAAVDHWHYPPDKGGLVAYAGYTVTDYIRVRPGHVLVVSDAATREGTSTKGLIRSGSPVFGADKTFVNTNDLMGVDDFSDHYHNQSDGVQYIRFNLNNGFTDLMIEEKSYNDGEFAPSGVYVPYGKYYINKAMVAGEFGGNENGEDERKLPFAPEEYFEDEINATVDSILAKTQTGPALVLTWLTDVHDTPAEGTEYSRHTKDTCTNIRAVQGRVPSHGIVTTGDWVLGNQDEYTQADVDRTISRLRGYLMAANDRVFMVSGNHDGPSGGVPKGSNYGSASAQSDEYTVRDGDAPWFYADYPHVNARVMFIATTAWDGAKTVWGVSDAQLAWIKATLADVPAGWSVMVFSHIGTFDQLTYGGVMQGFNSNRETVAAEFNAFHNHSGSYTQATGRVIAWFCGHEHFDWIVPGNKSLCDFPMIVTTASGMFEWNGSDIPADWIGIEHPERVDNTASQDAWDTIIYKPVEGKLYTVRFGAGNDREIDVDGLPEFVDEPTERQKIDKLSEEIAELKGEVKTEPVTYTPDIEGFLGTSGNFITSTEGTARTDYIALDGYVRVVAQSYISSNAYSLAFFSIEKQIIKDASVAGLGALTQNRIDMTIPADAAYCMLSHYSKGGNPGFITLYPADSADTEDPLFAKTTNVLGDSITSTGYTRPTWWEMIAEKAGCYFNNHGVSGTSIAVREGRIDSFVERAANMQTDADAVIVMGGTNDTATPRGAWNSTDNTTFFGALNILIGTLCDNFAGKPVIICTPIQTAGGYSSNVHNPAETLMGKTDTDTLTMQERAAAIKLKCEQYGMHCLDLYNGSGINGRDANKVYFRDGDSLHPSEAGQKRLANLMRRELESFFGID